jgi:hypothetical protein
VDTGTAWAVLLSVAALIIAALGVWYAAWQATIAQNAYEHAKQIHIEGSQPYVFVDIRSDSHQPQLVVLLIRNGGPTVATDVCLTIDPAVLVDPARNVPPLDKLMITALPPGAEMVRALGVGANFFDRVPDRITVSIDAKGPHGTVPTNSYQLDMAAFRLTAAGHQTLHDAAKALIEIQKHVKTIADKGAQ